MSDPYIRETGRVTEMDGMYLIAGVDHDTATIQLGGVKARLTAAQAEEFARLFVAACWQAGANKRQMDEETCEADGDTMHEPEATDGE